MKQPVVLIDRPRAVTPSRSLATSESVTEGHPDKVADQISDAVLDAVLADDPAGRVACEVLVTHGLVVVSGEITTSANVDIVGITRETIVGIGYDDERSGLDGHTCGVLLEVSEQCDRIDSGVSVSYEHRTGVSRDPLDSLGAGDQGIVVGYACDETDGLIPAPIWLAQRMTARLAEVRKTGVLPYLLPDGKTQVSVEYADGAPTRVTKVLVVAHHRRGVDQRLLAGDIDEHVVRPTLEGRFPTDGVELIVNANSPFDVGGPQADTGLTGRKIIVDTYGVGARHG